MDVGIVGGGIGGLALALELEKVGIRPTVYEAAAALRPIGVGINVSPQAIGVLSRLGLLEELSERGVLTHEFAYFNRFGQLITREPAGIRAGHEFPQISIHRGELQDVLGQAVLERLGPDSIVVGHRCVGFEQDEDGVTLQFRSPDGAELPAHRSDVAVACDGINSAIRKQLYPDDAPSYSGVNMWRGITHWTPFLSGATVVRAGWLHPGKLVVYPIEKDIDVHGHQLINWVVEVESEVSVVQDWHQLGSLDDFIEVFDDWRFDWLDVPAMIRSTELILEYPMIDRDPLAEWTFERVTLLGDAAHPMYPRGGNGSAQAIIDAQVLAESLASGDDVRSALNAYEQKRLPVTTRVVEASRSIAPDVLVQEVQLRTGDRPFENIDDVISAVEIEQIINRFHQFVSTGNETA